MYDFIGLYPALLGFAYQILIALAIFIIGRILIKILLGLIEKSLNKTGLDEGLKKFIVAFVKAAGYVLLVFIIAGRIGINSASILAVLGSAGIAIGLALQGSLSNLAGGLLILLMKPFTVGDYISYNGVEGKVDMIGLVYTTLISADNKKITLPNGVLSNGVVVNSTAYEIRRLDILIGVAYDSDIELVKKCIISGYKSVPGILTDSELISYIASFGDSSIVMGGRGWCKSADYLACKGEVLEHIKREFDKNEIEIPFNVLNVILDQDDTVKEIR